MKGNKMTKPYKLIAHLPEDKVAILPFYGYTVEDPEGKELGSFTKAVFTLEPDRVFCGKLTLYRKWVDKDGKLQEETIEDVDAEIEVRHWKKTRETKAVG